MKKKRIAALMSILCVLTLFSGTAWAAGETRNVGTKEEFLDAVADDSISTIALTASIDLSNEGVLDVSGKTIDLGGNTITSTHFTLFFEGKNFTLRNGTFASSSNSDYPLFLGDAGETDNVVIENIIMDGGINVFNATNVTLRNVNFTGKSYYAVWCDENAHVTIESGTFQTNGVAVLGAAIADSDGLHSTIQVNGGTFVADGKPLVLEGANYALPVISGGTFDSPVEKKFLDPTLKFELSSNGSYTYHQTMEEALENAQTGDLVTPVENQGQATGYQATLEYNDGTGKTIVLAADTEGKVSLPAVTRGGYAFGGWALGGTTYEAGWTITLSGNVTLTAQWKRLVSGISLDPAKLTLKEGETAQLTATLTPEDATDRSISWSSSDPAVATIDQNGKVTAQGAGTATIIATAKDGSGKSASCVVTVIADQPASDAQEESGPSEIPQTGDDFSALPWLALLSIACMGLTAYALLYHREKRLNK